MAAAAAPFQWSLAALETLMAEDQMDQHAAVLRAFSVVELWRLRRVCRAFHRWGTATSSTGTGPLTGVLWHACRCPHPGAGNRQSRCSELQRVKLRKFTGLL